jgi:DNA (cytosine-5)-methyltransferase 1
MAKKGIRTLSLFTGAGGLDIGFHKAGFDIVAAVEIERSFCDTLRANIGANRYLGSGQRVHCQDIGDFDPAPYKRQRIECVIGGPPCQTFSAAGRRAGGVIGTADLRGRLFQRYCDILKQLKPRAFVFENVYGLPGANGGGPWREIVSAFTKLGYSLKAAVVDAADYGAPQHRERLIMVGHKGGEFEFPLPTHGPDSRSGQPLVSVRDAIGDLQEPNEPYHNDLGGLYGHLLALVPQGLNYAYFTAEMGHPEPVFAWRSKFHDLLYKVNPDEPCRTIKAQPGKFTGPFHWKNRHFTVAELKRLQTFPDDYELVGSFEAVLEQIGNSVPPQLATVIATSVREQIFDNASRLTYPIRPFGFESTFRQRQRLRSQRFKRIAETAIKKQYPVHPSVVTVVSPRSERFFVKASSHFDRIRIVDKPRIGVGSVYEVQINDRKSHVGIRFQRSGVSKEALHAGTIEITGLKKYLGRIDTLTVESQMVDTADVFHLWSSIEQALVARSQFFTLIDIYGHYANRGDMVRIKSSYGFDDKQALHRAMDYFGDSLRCGDFMSLSVLAAEIGVNQRELAPVISRMRAERIDIRTDRTHPIIGKGRIICTYPFPLLSQKALVESRVQFLREQQPEFRFAAKAS